MTTSADAPETPAESPAADDRALLDWLSARDAACPVCDYGLRGIPEARCPECAAPLELAVASPRAVHAPWIFAVVSYSMAMGFDAVVATMISVVTVISGTYNQVGPYVLFGGFFTAAALCGIGLLRTVRGRRRWLRRGVKEQWSKARLVFYIVGGAHGVAGALFIFLVN